MPPSGKSPSSLLADSVATRAIMVDHGELSVMSDFFQRIEESYKSEAQLTGRKRQGLPLSYRVTAPIFLFWLCGHFLQA